MLSCCNVIQEITKKEYESILEIVSSTSTPVNVLDVQMSWSSDNEPIEEDSSVNAISSRQDNLTKRRKIITTIIDDNT